MNNLDFTANYLISSDLYLERTILCGINDGNKNDETFMKTSLDTDKRLDEFDGLASPRLLKSHLPAHLLPKEI